MKPVDVLVRESRSAQAERLFTFFYDTINSLQCLNIVYLSTNLVNKRIVEPLL